MIVKFLISAPFFRAVKVLTSKSEQSGTKPSLVAKILATKFGFVPVCLGGVLKLVTGFFWQLCLLLTDIRAWIGNYSRVKQRNHPPMP